MSKSQVKDFCRSAFTTTGTGAITIGSAVTGFAGVAAALADGDTFYYSLFAVDANGNPSGDYEIGCGTYTASGTSFTRDVIFKSSNSNNVVSLSAGTKHVVITAPAEVFAIPSGICQGRLTLTTAVPVTTADVTGATTIYFTPYNGNGVSLWNGFCWRAYQFAELSVALGTLSNASNYDVFLYDSSGTLTLAIGPAWTSDTGRGTGAGTTELALQDGVYVNNVAISGGPGAKLGRYLGTFRTTATTTTEDSYRGTSQAGGKRFLWNACNRVERSLGVIDTTDSWTYTTATWRQADSASGNKVEYVCGLSIEIVKAEALGMASNSGGSNVYAPTGIGVDSTSANSAKVFGSPGMALGAGSGPTTVTTANYKGIPGLGYHYLSWLEISVASGTTTFYGDNGSTYLQTGLQAVVWG